MRAAPRIRRLLAALLLALPAQAALACGHCVEDKVAAVYDHAVATSAFARKHQVAFFALDGKLAGTPEERRVIEQAARSAHGVDAGSVRASSEFAAVSVSFDPARVSYAALERSLERKLLRRGLRLLPLRVMDQPAVLRTAERR